MSARRFTAGLVQMRSTRSVDGNIAAASALIREAASRGAQYIQTPEMTSLLDRDRAAVLAAVRPEQDDAALAAFRALAKELGVWLHVGSLPIALEGERIANRAFVIDPEGAVAARYDKIHMFDVDLPNAESWRESRTYQPGDVAVIAELPWARLGLTICYDVRFAALHRALAENGAEVLAVPAAFTRQTGEAHWHVLLRARAIETGSFVLAAAQGGRHDDGRETFGHSLIVAPWGEILAEAGTEPGVITAGIDLAQAAAARARIPTLENGRRFAGPDPDAGHHLKVVQ